MNRKSKPHQAPSGAPDTSTSNQPETYFLVSERIADKLGQRAHGGLTFQVLTDKARSQLWVRVTANAGSGSFSDQPVSIDKLRRCVTDRETTKALRASALQPAIQARSACNAGFTAAALVNLGLLGKDPDKRHDLIDRGLWDSWSAEQLRADCDLVEVKLRPDPVEKGAPANRKTTKVEAPVEMTTSEESAPPEGAEILAETADIEGEPEAPDLMDDTEDSHSDNGIEQVAAVGSAAQIDDTGSDPVPARGRRKLKLRE